ncbi:MAG: hypothetical protein P4L33_05540 [Capsulimonadaceae bacterium]|nr:hypothetical protein [Capsulimonadaceae bacterium]
MVTPSKMSRAIRGQALIGLIIAIAIIITITAAMWGGMHKGVYGGAMDRANATMCISYTEQIRAAIMQYKSDYDGKNPPSLDALSKYGVVAEMYNTPGCVYQYDPNTGILTAPDNMRPGAPGGVAAGDGEGGHRHHHQADSTGGDQGTAAPANQTAPAAAPPAAPPAPAGGLPTTSVQGPGGMSIRVPTGAGGGGMGGQ